MNNVENIFKNKQLETFTRDVPEEATLSMLCMRHKVKCFEIEINGNVMVLAHFEHDGWLNIYQDGEGASSNHLFFWLTAIQGDVKPEDLILDFFKDSILRDQKQNATQE